MARFASVALAILLVLAVPPGEAQATRAPEVGAIVATLEPPYTRYEVQASDPDGDSLTFTWSNSNGCGVFTSVREKATWDHGDTTDCGHDSTRHDGTIRVVVSDGKGHEVVRLYERGSLSGEASVPDAHTNASPSPVVTAVPLCPMTAPKGALEPTQAVWQDDDFWRDVHHDHLVRVSDNERRADLRMVKDKPSLVFGVLDEGEGPDPEARYRVKLSATSTGTTDVTVDFVLTLTDASGPRTLMRENAVAQLKIGPPCGAPHEVSYTMAAPQGLPKGQTFTFPATGGYAIDATLHANGAPTGMTAKVTGDVVQTVPLKLLVLPVALTTPASENVAPGVEGRAANVAANTAKRVPDYYPIAPGQLQAQGGQLMDLSANVSASWLLAFQGFADKVTFGLKNYRGDTLAKAIGARAQRQYVGDVADLGGRASGYDRVAVIFYANGYAQIDPEEDNGVSYSGVRTFFLNNLGPDTLAHELAHTLPQPFFADSHMRAECDLNYHNKGMNISYGFEVTREGAYAPRKVYARPDLMGGEAQDRWIDQCTYKHLLDVFSGPIDPPTLVVRALLGAGEFEGRGALLPTYEVMGIADLGPDSPGAWTVDVRDAANASLGQYRFDPHFVDDLASVSFEVPRPGGAASLFVLDPTGAVVAERHRSAAAPRLEAEAHGEDDGLLVTWTASDADGDVLFASVYARLAGTWTPILVESDATRARLRADTSAVKVVVSDGWRSAEQVIEVRDEEADASATVTPTSSPEAQGVPSPAWPIVALVALAVALLRRRPAQ